MMRKTFSMKKRIRWMSSITPLAVFFPSIQSYLLRQEGGVLKNQHDDGPQQEKIE